ncbi:hypothetical protein VFPFJ_03022 [Purpureocillium lilacinum]|uniref:Uncharacterized protein n=1 Tax=Purpureocillium lilacinum TaxID=33203 RepID=A0A179GKJ8_PURLI|nr:hypothetical protein VFPFJ_03022 [Purpureocillium lilacinum]OAQ78407.1 hypothetical protein VFPBJ_06528 [Purpureocillium lilacinum]OAQ93859.1 hypothetical protein VFPFJ_03022 [Purpureocillium lilacinum]GJN81880.1 hypothetical protein PLIIFM63780_005416 [Purpureocillium lilacinum]
MKLQLALLSLVAAAVTAEDVQTAHLKFRAASSSETYDLAVKADGSSVDTDHADLSIHLIDAPDYLASSLCHFTTPQPVELSTTIADDNVTQQVVLDPPQPVLSVRCEGMCVGTYGACYDNNGQPVGPCCNGLCAANRCRPWNIGQH